MNEHGRVRSAGAARAPCGAREPEVGERVAQSTSNRGQELSRLSLRHWADEWDFAVGYPADHVECPIVVVGWILTVEWIASKDRLRPVMPLRLRKVHDEIVGIQILSSRVD